MKANSDTKYSESDIAIVAMECRAPGVENIDDLWRILSSGECTLSDISDEEIIASGVDDEKLNLANYVKRAGVLSDVDCFDSEYFGMGSIEADILDVQQRAMLESAVTVLNRGNVDPLRYPGRIGVFAGSAFSSYLFGILEQNDVVSSLGEMLIRHGNDKDFLAPRISYKLNLRGPSVNVQSACSTGLVAVHSACQSLMLGECDMAIAGAVNIRVPQHSGYQYQPDSIMSPDGNCRPFDSSANGTLFTNGLGLVLLKPLETALEDGDDVIAVIKGSAVGNDGADKVSFTAPSVNGQAQVLREAIEVAAISRDDLQYIEAHGTGTKLGDPIEIEAIKQAYGESGPVCGIGSLKGNLGHLNIAAGIVGLIKTALVLRHGQVPATLNFDTPNPLLELEKSRFYVTGETRTLDVGRAPIAAVSAFGMGGTNCHVIMAAAPPVYKQTVNDESRPQIITFSANSRGSTERLITEYRRYFKDSDCAELSAIAHTAYFGRSVLKNRVALVAGDNQHAATKLEAGDYLRFDDGDSALSAFVFSGQGTQNINMGAELASKCPKFKQNLECILAIFREEQGLDLESYLWKSDKEQEITSTRIAQPLLFAVELAVAQTLNEFGVRPDYLFGHSLGEVIAATFAGVFDLPTAVELITKRAELMDECEPGAMLVVDQLDGLAPIPTGVSIAARNSPTQIVLSGPVPKINALVTRAEEHGVAAQRLRTSHAFHSPLMEAASNQFLEFMRSIQFNEAQISLISNITGKLLTEYEYKNPTYWADHILRTVQFSESLDYLQELNVQTYVEIGHGHSMGNLVKANWKGNRNHRAKVVSSLGSVGEEHQAFLSVLASFWCLSGEVDLSPFFSDYGRAALPVYPFEKTRHWISPVMGFSGKKGAESENAPLVSTNTPSSEPLKIEAEPAATEELNNNESNANPVEAIVTEIYASHLGSISDSDASLFDLGGNSLIAIQLINKLRETFQLDIPLSGFYANSSVSAISTNIAKQLLENEVEYE